MRQSDTVEVTQSLPDAATVFLTLYSYSLLYFSYESPTLGKTKQNPLFPMIVSISVNGTTTYPVVQAKTLRFILASCLCLIPIPLAGLVDTAAKTNPLFMVFTIIAEVPRSSSFTGTIAVMLICLPPSMFACL